MNNAKRVLLGLVLLITCCLINAQDVMAETEDNFVYSVSTETDMAIITGYEGTETEIIIPDTIAGYRVGELSNSIFAGNTTVESVDIQANLVYIPNSAFFQCAKLKSVKLPVTLERIAPYAFYGCTSLDTIEIPNSVSIIQASAFQNCTSLLEILLPDNLNVLGEQVFRGCSSLKVVGTEVNNKGFFTYNNVLFNKEMTKLIFYPCTLEDQSYTIPNGVESIGAYAFDGVTNLKILSIPDSVISIDENALCNVANGFKIDCSEGSVAETFAKDNDFSIGDSVDSDVADPDDSTGSQVGTTTPDDSTGTQGGTTTPDDSTGSQVGTTTPNDSTGNQGSTSSGITTGGTTNDSTNQTPYPEEIVKPIVKLNATSVPLQLKKSTTAIKIKSKMAGDTVSRWTSSNKKIIVVNKKTGKITAKKVGTAYVIVTMKSGATARCKVKVQKKAVKVTKISVNKSKVTLILSGKNKKKTFKLNVTKKPITSLEKVTYKTSNKKVVTVSSSGKLTAKKKGTATITIKCGKKTKKVKVTVKKK